MFGLVAALALAGLATAAWPLYLHLRRQRKRITQLVPSLILFQWRTVLARRRRVEQLLLLLCRIGILTALFFLVSQPFLETTRDLPLPRFSATEDSDCFLGVVIDDSLSAFHGEEEAERLKRGRAWLLAQLDRLPETVRISVATASYPRSTGFLAKEDARKLVEQMRVIPRQGDARGALESLIEFFGNRKGAIVVIAPRDTALWRLGESPSSARSLGKLFVYDTTTWQTDGLIHRVQRGKSSTEEEIWICELAGAQERLAGRTVHVLDRTGKQVYKREVSRHEALEKRLVLQEAVPAEAFQVSFAAPDAACHPWHRYYLAPARQAEHVDIDRLVFLREEGNEALLATRIVAATVRALRPDIPRTFATFNEASAEEIPDARGAIVVGSGNVPLRVTAWLQRQVERGIRVLCLPGAARTGGEEAGVRRYLPVWGPPARFGKNELSPLRISMAQLPDTHRFEDPLLSDLNDVAGGTLCESSYARGGDVVLAAASGTAILSCARANDRSVLWALGAMLSMEEGLTYHPIFPLLVDWILFPAGAAEEEHSGSLLVGDSVNVARWFEGGRAGATLVTPSGQKTPLAGEQGNPFWIPRLKAGIYELKSKDRSHYRVVNHARPAEGGSFARTRFEADVTVQKVVWLREEEFIPLAELQSSSQGAQGPAPRYDLTVLMAALLAGFLGMELLLLLRYWRNATAVPR